MVGRIFFTGDCPPGTGIRDAADPRICTPPVRGHPGKAGADAGRAIRGACTALSGGDPAFPAGGPYHQSEEQRGGEGVHVSKRPAQKEVPGDLRKRGVWLFVFGSWTGCRSVPAERGYLFMGQGQTLYHKAGDPVQGDGSPRHRVGRIRPFLCRKGDVRWHPQAVVIGTGGPGADQ